MSQDWIDRIAAEGNRRAAAAQQATDEKTARRDAEVPSAERYWHELWEEIAAAVARFNEASHGRYALVPSARAGEITVKRQDASGRRDTTGATLVLDLREFPVVRGTHPGTSSPGEFQARFQFDEPVTLDHKTPAEYTEWLLTPVFEAAIAV